MESVGNQMYKYYRGDATEYDRNRILNWNGTCLVDKSRYNQNRINFNMIDYTKRKCNFFCNNCKNTKNKNTYDCNVCSKCVDEKEFKTKWASLRITSAANIKIDECFGYGCTPEMCDAWHNQMYAYTKCQTRYSPEECKRRFGCKQWEQSRYRFTPPLSPRLTNCEPCWIKNYTNI